MADTSIDQDAILKVHRQQFSLPQLPTTSVTIYPMRASVVRTIKDVTLKPGRNEIILHQLTPVADENSIKVSGRLLGRNGIVKRVLLLADMTVDLVKPPAAPSIPATKSKPGVSTELESDEEDNEEVTVSDTETPTIKELSERIRRLEISIATAKEGISSTEQQVAYLERWGSALTTERTPPAKPEGTEFRSTTAVSEYISTYSKTRSELWEKKSKLSEEVKECEKELGKAKKQKGILVKNLLNKKKKAKEERLRKKEELRERLREEGAEDEKNSGGPEKWYRVRVWIERTDEEIEADHAGKEISEGAENAELELTYTVTQAGWVSKYDIVISSSGETHESPEGPTVKTGKPTAFLTYHAHFQNRTYETWRDALITLSTSQTAYTGLTDIVPPLEPWRVRLQSWNSNQDVKNVVIQGNINTDEGVQAVVRSRCGAGHYSSQERGYIAQERKEENDYVKTSFQPHAQAQQAQHEVTRMRKSAFGGFRRSERSVSMKKSPLISAPASTFRTRSSAGGPGGPPGGAFSSGSEGDDTDSESDDDTASLTDTLTPQSEAASPPKPKFVTQGMTSSYSIPRKMTIPSTDNAELASNSSAVRRHAILTVPLSHLRLSHVSTPKLRAVAYLKARVFNSSATTLRKGLIGITLDGTFIGTTALPKNVYPGGFFNLGLGIDESVGVMYAKPTVKRTILKSGGFLGTGFGRADSEVLAVYGRSTVIRNSRLDRGPIELVVTDQVPVSEDAKLVVNVSWPRGLKPPASQIATAPKGRWADEGETIDEDSAFGDATGNKFGQWIKTGTGVYFEGFKITIEEELDTSQPSAASGGLAPPPPAPSTATTSGSSERDPSPHSKKRTSFFGKSKFDSSTSSGNSGNTAFSPAARQRQTTSSPSHSSAVTRPGEPIKDAKWGSAAVAMRRNGEVVWKVKLNPGMGVRLGLEYEARVPAGESIKGM